MNLALRGRGLGAWLAAVDWLTAGAFLLTIGAFLGAVLDSYTSLCVVGGDLAHIGRASSCPDVHGWDTRTFPLAVDMGWGGALLATIKLARTIGLDNWRWWVVLGFEVLVAGTTVAGNAVHGAVVAGSANHLLLAHPTATAAIASAVPGVVAVGAGFTLSALISSRHVDDAQLTTESQPATPIADAGGPVDKPAAGEATGERDRDPNRIAHVPARVEVRRLLKRYGEGLTAERVAERTAVSIQHARKLLREERAAMNGGQRPHLLQMETAAPESAVELTEPESTLALGEGER